MKMTKLTVLIIGLLLVLGACDNGPDPAEQMAAQFDSQSSSAPADTGSADSAMDSEEPAEANPCAGAEDANPCGETDAANPCGEAEAANPCEEAEAANPCGDEAEANPCSEEANPCAEEEAGEEAENPCAEEPADNPCAEAEMEDDMETEAALEEEVVEEELDPVDSFMELDPRDIIRAKQVDLADRLTAPWDEDNPDGFIPETGRVDPLTLVSSAVPDELKPTRSGSTDENEIETYLARIFATQLVDQVSASLQCHSVIEIGVVSTAYFTIGGGENAQRFAMQEGSGRNINGANVTCTGVSDSKVSVTISVNFPGVSVSRSKIYIPRSVN